ASASVGFFGEAPAGGGGITVTRSCEAAHSTDHIRSLVCNRTRTKIIRLNFASPTTFPTTRRGDQGISGQFGSDNQQAFYAKVESSANPVGSSTKAGAAEAWAKTGDRRVEIKPQEGSICSVTGRSLSMGGAGVSISEADVPCSWGGASIDPIDGR